MTMRLMIEADLDYAFPNPADVLLQIEAAALPDQTLEEQALTICSDHPIHATPGEDGIGQRTWARGEGRLIASYRAIVQVRRDAVDLAALDASPLHALPGTVVGYLLPSRYCEAHLFDGFIRDAFPGLTGGAMVTALATWVCQHLRYEPGCSGGHTTAAMTFASRRGVCRDYAHLLVALARAAEIPARCVAVYAPGVDPPDFHAVAEVWLDGAWRLVDPTGMADAESLVRVAVGRDATDIAFMTVFGTAHLLEQRVRVVEIGQERPSAPIVLPVNQSEQEGEMGSHTKDAMDRMSVAPDPQGNAAGDDTGSSRSDAGTDRSIAQRLEERPDSKEARLDTALDQSMDASDPPSSTQPVHNQGPAPSSGFDEEAERRRSTSSPG